MKNLGFVLFMGVVLGLTIHGGTAFADAAPAAAAPAASVFSKVWAFLDGSGGAILFFVLFSIDQMLANIFPSLKANSVYELLTVGLTKAEAKNPLPGATPPAAS